MQTYFYVTKSRFSFVAELVKRELYFTDWIFNENVFVGIFLLDWADVSFYNDRTFFENTQIVFFDGD